MELQDKILEGYEFIKDHDLDREISDYFIEYGFLKKQNEEIIEENRVKFMISMEQKFSVLDNNLIFDAYLELELLDLNIDIDIEKKYEGNAKIPGKGSYFIYYTLDDDFFIHLRTINNIKNIDMYCSFDTSISSESSFKTELNNKISEDSIKKLTKLISLRIKTLGGTVKILDGTDLPSEIKKQIEIEEKKLEEDMNVEGVTEKFNIEDFDSFKLNDWWNNKLIIAERNIILESLPNCLYSDNNRNITKTLMFIYSRIDSREKSLRRKILEEVQNHVFSNNNFIDLHYMYLEKIKFYYKDRENPNSLDFAIEACRAQISIAKDVIKIFAGRKMSLPEHTGYKQLSIILDKQNKHDEAIIICQQALEQGWAGDWQKRVARYEKVVAKRP